VYLLPMSRAPSGRETTTPITARMTSSAVAEIDVLAAELRLTRGSVVTLLVSAALRYQDQLLGTFRQLRARTHGGGR
jgi:hypothetical protein